MSAAGLCRLFRKLSGAVDGPAHLLHHGEVGLVKEVHVDFGGGVGAAVAQGPADGEEGHVAAVGDAGEAVAQAVEGRSAPWRTRSRRLLR